MAVDGVSRSDLDRGEVGHAFVVGATSRAEQAAEAEVEEMSRELRSRERLARWWSFPLSDDAQAALRVWPYLYIYVGVPTQRIVARHRVSDFRTSSGNQGILCPWPEYQPADSIGKTRAGTRQNEIFKTWFLIDQVERLPRPIPLNQLETVDGLAALPNSLVNGFGIWRGSVPPTIEGLHVLLKWAARNTPDTIERHRQLADENGSVWWGDFGNPGVPAVSVKNLESIARQVAEGRPTYAFLYNPSSVWRAAIEQITTNPDEVDERRMPTYYTKDQCKLFVRLSGFYRLDPSWITVHLVLASQPNRQLDQGALSNQTTPLLVRYKDEQGVSRHWIFQSNPERFDLLGSAQESKVEEWSVNRHRSEIKVGDRIWFRVSGPDAGLYIEGTVKTEPYDAPGDEFGTWKVKASYDNYIDPPLLVPELDQHPTLTSFKPLFGVMGTNFRVPTDVAEELEKLTSGRLRPLAVRTAKLGSISETLSEILAGYPGARQSGTFGAGHPIWAAFERVKQLLATNRPVADNPHLVVRFSVGQGNWAKVPWIAILDDRETRTTQQGVYCVFLFRADGSGVYLTLNQGVTEPQRQYGRPDARRFLRERAATLRAQTQGLSAAGFQLNDQVDLGAGSGLGEDYEGSTIAHKLYLATALPDDDSIFEDLEAVLLAYQRVIAPQEPPADLRSVLHAFSETLATTGLQFGENHDRLVRSFLASLMTKPLVILTGLSGSGKTQIAVKFGEWLGLEHCRVVPVRPDWTGPEALFGYKDLLQPPAADGRRTWVVPEVLDFILTAARDATSPYALVLDEMNLAHVERYFADFLSGMETGKGVVPSLVLEKGVWRESNEDAGLLPIPRNLFVIGTVNVDETTYMFSPKVLDRANTLEFRVYTSDLSENATKPGPARAGEPQILRNLLRVATDDRWQNDHPTDRLADFTRNLKALHGTLSVFDSEFGHRSFYEAHRFASIYASLGDPSWEAALDLQVMQKILPKMHGSRRKLEPVLSAVGQFAFDLTGSLDSSSSAPQFDLLALDQALARLPQSFSKIRRMLLSLRMNQFASFAE